MYRYTIFIQTSLHSDRFILLVNLSSVDASLFRKYAFRVAVRKNILYTYHIMKY